MKTTTILASLLLITQLASALPPSQHPADSFLSTREASIDTLDSSLYNDLEKRRGGGGGGRGGGGRGGGRSGGSSSGSRSVSSYSFSPQSNLGGRTRDGSGTRPMYGGYYSGGATVPYTAGQRSSGRGLMPLPFLLPITALAFFPALWLYPVYAYPYAGYGGYHWRADDGQNKTANVTCLCQQYSVCGCDNQNDTVVALQLTDGAGSGAPVNNTQVRVVDFGNGNITAYVNGTLDNGTTASGGTEPSNENQISAATRLLANYGGYWVAIGVVSLLVTSM